MASSFVWDRLFSEFEEAFRPLKSLQMRPHMMKPDVFVAPIAATLAPTRPCVLSRTDFQEAGQVLSPLILGVAQGLST